MKNDVLMRSGSPWSDVRLGLLGESGNQGFHDHENTRNVWCPREARGSVLESHLAVPSSGSWSKGVISAFLSRLTWDREIQEGVSLVEPGLPVYRKRSGERLISRPRIADRASGSCRLPSSGADKRSGNSDQAGPSWYRFSGGDEATGSRKGQSETHYSSSLLCLAMGTRPCLASPSSEPNKNLWRPHGF